MATALLIAAIVLPMVLYWSLRSRFHLSNLTSAISAIAIGWVLSVAWAVSSDESLAIAGAFGWVCPAVLVACTALAWRFIQRRPA